MENVAESSPLTAAKMDLNFRAQIKHFVHLALNLDPTKYKLARTSFCDLADIFACDHTECQTIRDRHAT